jgi:hypothetical protein
MCTSFVLYADETYIGMNFDISDRPIKLSMKGADQLLVLQKDGPRFLPALGINGSGTFVNLLMVDPNEAGVYRRGKNCIHIIRLFDDVLGGRTNLPDLGAYLQDKTVVNVPKISVHSMIAGRGRCAYVVEPGRATIPFDSAGRDWMVLTNFPLSDFSGRDYRDATGSGSERYKTCYRMLSESRDAFSVDQGFAILAETAQSAGDYPTQFSMLALPEDGVVHFAIERAFSKRYTFSFADRTVRTGAGFERQVACTLGRKGVLLSELAAW